jgi:hypothetical protein
MQKKTSFPFLPFLALAAILCIAAVVGVYLRISQQATPTPLWDTPVATPMAETIDASTTKDHANAPGDAYPASARATPTPTQALEHGYPVPGAKAITPTIGPKDVATDTVTPTTSVTPAIPTYVNYLPMISDGKYPFTLQETGVIATQGFSGCSWTGVAGQVFSLSGDPLLNLIIHLQGTFAGASINQDAISGVAVDYGPAGYLFVLGTQPLATANTLTVQLLDANRKALSLPIAFSTFADCAHNLILVNFVQNY